MLPDPIEGGCVDRRILHGIHVSFEKGYQFFLNGSEGSPGCMLYSLEKAPQAYEMILTEIQIVEWWFVRELGTFQEKQ